MTTRTGKIARLPKDLREQLNRRLQDGEPGPQLVDWLNGLEPVQQVLARGFEGRPLTGQNLSEWRQGGYQDWVRLEEARALVGALAEEAGELGGTAGWPALMDQLALVLTAELAVQTQRLHEVSDPDQRWAKLQVLLRELARLRRAEDRRVRTRLEQERWQQEQGRLEGRNREGQRAGGPVLTVMEPPVSRELEEFFAAQLDLTQKPPVGSPYPRHTAGAGFPARPVGGKVGEKPAKSK